MRQRIAIAWLPLLAACALGGHVASRPPLENEGEVYLELQPLPPEAARVVFELQSVEAVGHDGAHSPLDLVLADISPAAVSRQRLLASGQLAPGQYRGFSVVVRRASVATADARADLLVSAEPVTIDAPFSISARRAAVISIQFRPATSVDKGYKFTASFSAAAAPKTVPQLTGFCSNAGSHDVTVFDRRSREVTAVVPEGRSPWGMALDPLQNRAYVALEGEDQIAVIDIASGTEISRIRLNAGDAPREIALAPDRRLLVAANSGSNTVSFIDAAAMIETGRVAVGEQPGPLLLDRKGTRVYVSNLRGNSFSVIDLGTRTVVATLPSDSTPLRAQIDRASTRLYLASPLASYLTVLSLPDLALVKRVYLGTGTSALKVDPDTDLIYVAGSDGRLSLFDSFSLIPVDFIDLPGAATYLAIDAAENVLFALLPDRRSIAVVHLTTKAVLTEVDVGLLPRVVALMGERN